ncbi:MAG TPA: B12-binding domain-containing radical SAM protein, partial [Sumerlaeia bacterium]|nr:B12-binding domain-containing radical SAM protein [Sumerlaeia bacterium]
RLEGCVVFAFRGVRILPGTGIHRRAVEEGVVGQADSLLEPRFYYSPEVTEGFLDAAIAKSFAPRHDRIYPPGQGMDRIQAFHRMGRRGPIWDLLLANGRRQRGTR